MKSKYFNFIFFTTIISAIKIKSENQENLDNIIDKIITFFPFSENFNIFKYLSKIKNDTLLIYKLADYALDNLIGIKTKNQIVNKKILRNFLLTLAQEYNINTLPKINPYHNLIHAGEVIHTLFIYLEKSKKNNNTILFKDTYVKQIEELNNNSNITYNDLDIFALIIAAACHDFKHPGRSNNFYLNYHDKVPFAKILKEYNYKLELYHYAEATKLIEKIGLINNLNKYQKKRFYKVMKIAIYGTENALNKKHAENLIKYKNIMNDISINKNDNELDDIKLKMFECLLHAADISNPTKNTKYFIIWSKKLNEEICEQSKEINTYDKSKEINCTGNDEKKFRETELSFFKNVIEEFYKPFCELFYYLDYTCENYEKNKKFLQGSEKIFF